MKTEIVRNDDKEIETTTDNHVELDRAIQRTAFSADSCSDDEVRGLLLEHLNHLLKLERGLLQPSIAIDTTRH